MKHSIEPIKIIIADDHEIFRKGFQVLLKKQHLVKVIAEAENGKDLVDKVALHQPDVVITDIQMPEMDGIEATGQLLQQNPELGVIALSMFNDDNLIVDMVNKGARGYLLKNTNKEELLEAIDAVHKGETYFCNATSKKLTRLIGLSKVNLGKKESKCPLVPKEIEIIRLICQEYSSKQIAAQMGYTTRTIENYREKIQEKIGAKNMVGIAVYAIKHNLYQP